MRFATCLFAVLGLCVLLAAPSSATWHARGGFYGIDWEANDGNMLNDDGVNGDAVAGDGIISGFVTATVTAGDYQFKIGMHDWSEAHPASNVPLHLTEDFQTVFFSLNTNFVDDGWFPAENIVWCDALYVDGISWRLVGGHPEMGSWDPTAGPLADFDGTLWNVVVEMNSVWMDWYKWTANDVWDVQQLGFDGVGSDTWNIELNIEVAGLYEFLFDPNTGRGWHGRYEPTPTEDATWGRIKGLYR